MNQYQQNSNHDDDDRIVSLWNHLIEIETNVALMIYDYLHSYHQEWLLLSDDKKRQREIEMNLKGVRDAKEWIELDFNTLTKTFRDWVRPYELKYREWRVADLPNNEVVDEERYKNVWKIIVDHETTLLNCWEKEYEGESGLPLLQDFLMRRIGISIQ
jgi:hypothetical protein